MNCVDSEAFLASEPQEKACIQNCQEKTYQAFDLMMAVKMRCEARKAADSVLDISRYTEMDIEKGHDTAGVIGASHGVHADYKHLDMWNETKQSYEGAKQKALDHTQ